MSVRVKLDTRGVRVRDVQTFTRTLVRIAAHEVGDRAAAYPPEGPWNRPKDEPGKTWYQRHFGPRWRRVDGSIGGRNTSEQMQKRWRRRIDELRARVWNDVSYAPYLLDRVRMAYSSTN